MKEEIRKEGEVSITSPEATVCSGESLLAYGLLGQSRRTRIEIEIAEQREEMARLLVRLELSRRENYFQSHKPGFGGFQALQGKREAEFDKRLYDFAIERRISFYPHDTWRMRVLEQAAKEHPDLDPAKRKRGRPKETSPGLLFSYRASNPDPAADPHYKHIEAERLRAARKGVRFSQVACIRKMILRDDPHLAKLNNGANFAATVKAIEKKIGAYRRQLNASLRPTSTEKKSS